MITTFQIRVDEELKNTFMKVSKDKGLDGSMLIRYFMKSFTDKSEIVNFDISDDFFNSMMNDNQIKSKLEKISNKLDKIGF